MAKDYPAKGTGAKKKQHPRAELAHAIEKLAKIPFPTRSTDDQADQLHAELLLFDSSVGEAVMAVANGERVPDEELRLNDALRRDLEAMITTGEAPAAADARMYLDYLSQLEHLLQLAKATKNKRGTS